MGNVFQYLDRIPEFVARYRRIGLTPKVLIRLLEAAIEVLKGIDEANPPNSNA